MTDNINHLHSSVMTEFPVEMCIWLYVSIRQINKQDTNFKLLEVFFLGKTLSAAHLHLEHLPAAVCLRPREPEGELKKKLKIEAYTG